MRVAPNDLFRVLVSQGWSVQGVVVVNPRTGEVGIQWIECPPDIQEKICKALAQGVSERRDGLMVDPSGPQIELTDGYDLKGFQELRNKLSDN
jgi:hypothetical protein